MKGLVLAGGKGSRLRPFTYSGAKQLVPIANTPVLHFPIRQLVEAGVVDIGIVVGDTEAQIREAMGDGSTFGARFTYLRQPEPLGIAHAVAIAASFLGNDPFVLYLGDNVLQGGIASLVEGFASSNAAASLVLKPVEDSRAFGVALFDGERLARVIEKPAEPPSNLAVVGVYAFRPAVFAVIDEQTPSARGELEIADTINGLLAAGAAVEYAITERNWIDTGKMEDMLAANRAVLDEIEPAVAPSAMSRSTTISGAVRLGEGVSVDHSVLEGPVVVGPGTRIEGCRIGPYVAIGAGCVLGGVTMEDTIVMDASAITGCPGIVGSMIGRFAEVRGAPAGSRLTLGDHSRFEVGR